MIVTCVCVYTGNLLVGMYKIFADSRFICICLHATIKACVLILIFFPVRNMRCLFFFDRAYFKDRAHLSAYTDDVSSVRRPE